MLVQQDLRGRPISPRGLSYTPEAITPRCEEFLIREISSRESCRFRHPVLRAQAARRGVVCYGHEYLYDTREASAGEEIPEYLEDARRMCAATARVG